MRAKRNKQILLFFFRDKNKKSWLQIIKEFTTLCISQKKLPVNYITCMLYRKNVSCYKDYLTLKESERLMSWSYSRAKEEIVIAENKLLFGELLVKNNISTPQIFFYNSKSKFTYKDDVFEIDSKKEFFTLIERVFLELNIEHIFCKPLDGMKGHNIFVLNKTTFHTIEDKLINLVISTSYIFQDLILQHETLNKLNFSCINTLRVVTYKNEENIVEILSGFIRLGRKGAIVDNADAGGIVVSFDKETGKMDDEGLQLTDKGGGVFYKHPDSGIIFDNYQIPYYTHVKELVIKASSLFKIPLLGWDVAITPNGPVIVEVNHNFYLLLSDRMEKGLKNNPSFKKLLDEIQ